jgi:hypothetical protein
VSESRQHDVLPATSIDHMTALQTTFRIHPIPADVLAEVRRCGRGDAGYPVEHLCAEGGEPLRCCLRNAVAGEALILFGYAPPMPASPYTEIGAVYAHAADCPGPLQPDRYPADWLGKPQALRAYDARGWIHPATTTHDGSDPQGAIAEVLADPGVVQVHSRNLAYGCFMFAVTRANV